MSSTPTAASGEDLLQFACAELKRRLAAGEACRAEEYLSAFPTLTEQAEWAVELIYAEWETRRQLGQEPSPQEWLERFPRWREQLRPVLEVEALLASTPSEDATAPEQSPATPREPRTGSGDARGGGDRPGSLDHHELYEKIGDGGMGVVYRAWDPELHREVALKLIRSRLLAGPKEVERFYQEARLASRLRHPNIITIFGMGLFRSEYCFTMELMKGGSLAQHLKRFREPRQAAELIEKVARAVQAAHDAGVIHRDLKPANIFLNDKGEPVVGDFGLAKLADIDVSLTQSGTMIGTPAYMAPEQFPGRGPVTAQADVWALGVLLFELLTGQRPFTGETWQKLERQICGAAAPRLRHLRPDLDKDLETIVSGCLERDIQRRYPTATALAEDLSRWRVGASVLHPSREPGRRRRVKAVAPLLALLATTAVSAAVVGTVRPPLTRPGSQQPGPAERVVLIGSEGPPVTQHWLIGDGSATAGVDNADGTFFLRCRGRAALELCSRPPWKSYRLEAEVRHDENPGFGSVGLFFGHSEAPSRAEGSCHCFFPFTFSDRGLREGHAELEFWCTATAGSPPGVTIPLRRQSPPRMPDGRSGGWRPIAVEVTPQSVRVSWRGERVGTLTQADLQKETRGQLDKLPAPLVAFPPRGGLGVFVVNGKASFRHVRIVSLRSGALPERNK
jgi:serine/threonine-protein kinase